MINRIDKENLNKSRLKEIINEFSNQHLLVVGDLILDEYLLGNPERISREAPVLILKYINSKFKLGGSSNAADNAAALGAKVTLCGVLGDDFAGNEFSKLCKELGINLLSFADPGKYTTVKTRIVSSSSSNPDAGTGVKQQVLRIDKEDHNEISKKTETEMLAKLESIYASIKPGAVLLSDYSNGVFTNNLAKQLIKATNDRNLKTIVDSNGDFAKFSGAYSLTPNQPDLEKVIKRPIQNDQDCLDAAMEILQKNAIEVLLTTRGAKGMCISDKSGNTFIPAFNLSEVFDVSGAGDTVAAAYSLSLAVGASPVEAAIIGNLAASLVVRKYGTATTNKDELFKLIDTVGEAS